MTETPKCEDCEFYRNCGDGREMDWTCKAKILREIEDEQRRTGARHLDGKNQEGNKEER